MTKNVLLKRFASVDLLEQNKNFTKQASKYLEQSELSRVGNIFNIGLQEFVFHNKGEYNIIWIQFVLGHLTDKDLIEFFAKCREGVREGGIIVIKDNFNDNGFMMDKVDSSVTRRFDF